MSSLTGVHPNHNCFLWALKRLDVSFWETYFQLWNVARGGASTLCFLQTDLVSTIGESAAMGTAGVVIWEKSEMKLEVKRSFYCCQI